MKIEEITKEYLKNSCVWEIKVYEKLDFGYTKQISLKVNYNGEAYGIARAFCETESLWDILTKRLNHHLKNKKKK